MRVSKTASIISVLFLVGLAEGVSRFIGFGNPPTVVLDDTIEYYVTPNSLFKRYGNEIKTNKFGMRSEAISAGKENVFLLGDSVVYGNHFLDQSETMSYVLPALLSAPYSVYSIAASSWGPANILSYVKKFGAFQGKYAIIVQSSHDRFDIKFVDNDIIPYRESGSYSAITDFAHAVYERVQQKVYSKSDVVLSQEDMIHSTENDLSELIVLLKSHFDAVALLYHATQSELGQADTEGSLHFKRIAKYNDITFLSSLNFYPKNCSIKDIYRDDIHLTRKGSLCASRFMSQWINSKIEEKFEHDL